MNLQTEEATARNWVVKQWASLTPTGKCLAAVAAAFVVLAVLVVVL